MSDRDEAGINDVACLGDKSGKRDECRLPLNLAEGMKRLLKEMAPAGDRDSTASEKVNRFLKTAMMLAMLWKAMVMLARVPVKLLLCITQDMPSPVRFPWSRRDQSRSYLPIGYRLSN